MSVKKIKGEQTLLEAYINEIIPEVREGIERLQMLSSGLYIKAEAEKSLKEKRVHLLGSCVYACGLPKKEESVNFFLGEAAVLDFLDDYTEGNSSSFPETEALHSFMLRPICGRSESGNFDKNIRKGTNLIKYLERVSEMAGPLTKVGRIDAKARQIACRSLREFIRTQAIATECREKRRKLTKEWMIEMGCNEKQTKEWYLFKLFAASPMCAYAIIRLGVRIRYGYAKPEEYSETKKIHYLLGGINVFGDRLQDLETDNATDNANEVREFRTRDHAVQEVKRLILNVGRLAAQSTEGEFHILVLSLLIEIYFTDTSEENNEIRNIAHSVGCYGATPSFAEGVYSLQ